MKDLDKVQDQLWKWANQNLGREIKGFTLDTCTRSGSIWWQKGDTHVYLNYNWDNEGDVISGSVWDGCSDLGYPIPPVDCSALSSFEQVLEMYLHVSIYQINDIVAP